MGCATVNWQCGRQFSFHSLEFPTSSPTRDSRVWGDSVELAAVGGVVGKGLRKVFSQPDERRRVMRSQPECGALKPAGRTEAIGERGMARGARGHKVEYLIIETADRHERKQRGDVRRDALLGHWVETQAMFTDDRLRLRHLDDYCQREDQRCQRQGAMASPLKMQSLNNHPRVSSQHGAQGGPVDGMEPAARW